MEKSGGSFIGGLVDHVLGSGMTISNPARYADRYVPETPKRGAFGKSPLVFRVPRYRTTAPVNVETHDCAVRLIPQTFGNPRLVRMRRKLTAGRLRMLELMGCDLNVAFKDAVKG